MWKKTLKTICASLLVTSMFSNIVAYASDGTMNEQSETFNMVTTDLETGEKIVEEVCISNDASVLNGEACIKAQSPRNVIGEDERTEVPDIIMSYVPYSTIGVITVYYEDGSVNEGTGFLIGPNDVATAAHVIAGEGVSFFTFMFPNDVTDTYECTVMSVPQEYYDTQASIYDWAVFEIDENVGNTRGYCGWSTDISVGDTVQVIGYPSDKPNGLWMAGKQVKSLSEHLMGYDVDTEGGQSGSPVILAGTTGICTGIHVGAMDSINCGTRVTNRMASIFSLYREQ